MKNDMYTNIQFIRLIEERPCLYDYNRSDYGDKYSQEAAWLEIAKNVNKSVAVCKERWKNLRGCYTRHLKKNNRPSGSSTKLVKPYYLAEHLQFLYSYTKSRPPKDKFKMEEHDIENDLERPNEIDNDSENSHEFEKPLTSSSPADIKEACNRDFEQFSIPNQPIEKTEKVFLSDVNDTTAMEYFHSRQKTANYNDNQDPDLAFLYSLLPDVKDMSREQKRRFKVGVLKLANDILQENLSASPASQNSDS